MRSSELVPLAVPFVDNAIKVVDVHWSSSEAASIRVLSRRSGRACVVEFEAVSGLRILHEVDLASLWMSQSSDVLKSSWLFEVHGGGWLDLESTRQDFFSTREPGVREFMIAGYQECVSIFAHQTPVLRDSA